jgi:hypothetical protein
LPGCLLAGTGVGIANSSVTNTVMKSMPRSRAGIASGMDMTARLISLAVNIALMGLVLLSGVRSSLAKTFPTPIDANRLRVLAEHLVAGGTSASENQNALSTTPLVEIVHTALSHGFSLIMLYGGIGAWALAAVSYAAFGPATSNERPDSTPVYHNS